MRTSSLRHKVTFQKNTEARDDFGDVTDVWVDVASEWVQIIPLKGEEKFMSEHLNTIVDHKVRMRYRDGLNSKMKILYGGRMFEIDSILNPYERRRELQLMVSEVFDA